MARLFWLTVMAAFVAGLLAGAPLAGALLAVGTLLRPAPPGHGGPTTPLLSAGKRQPPRQPLVQPTNRAPAMRHALLRRHRRLGERHPEITGKEERIVSEAAAAAGLGEDPAVARCFDQLRLGERRVEICHHTTVARGALVVGNAREPLEQQPGVRRVSPPPPPHLRPTRPENPPPPPQRAPPQAPAPPARRDGATLPS